MHAAFSHQHANVTHDPRNEARTSENRLGRFPKLEDVMDDIMPKKDAMVVAKWCGHATQALWDGSAWRE
jgi:hypothetical protein